MRQLLPGLVLVSAVISAPTHAVECAELRRAVVRDTVITQAQLEEARDGLPAYCAVRGYVRPAIGFELRLPREAWNGKFLMAGCGGFCGQILADKPDRANSINLALQRGYAAITTDGGHWGESPVDATWAYGGRRAEIDYAQRSVGEVARVGKELVTRFYDRTPARSYFSGCSNGGRMALIAAQRYPTAFDGIVSGCPVLNLSGAGGISGAWVIGANTRSDGTRIFPEAKASLLARAVLQECDAEDGLRDGQIDDPRLCRFDPLELVCKGSENPATCLSREEAMTARAWYQGPRNRRGVQLFPGIPRGSETFWPIWLTGTNGGSGRAMALGGGYLRYVGFEQDPGPEYDVHDFDFDRDPPRLEFMARLMNADDPDLGRFEAAGGKMILYHGWADPAVVPGQSVDYYEAVLQRMGGIERVATFFRFFPVPGMGHCWEKPGPGADEFDPLVALEAWVERGEAPARIVATKRRPDGSAERTRPLCPYPQKARLRTGLDSATADSFDCTSP